MGSSAGAAHWVKSNLSVQSSAQWERNSHVDYKGKSPIDLNFQY